MDRVLSFLLTIGMPSRLVDGLRRRPFLVILLLGILAWVPVLLLVWLFLRLLG